VFVNFFIAADDSFQYDIVANNNYIYTHATAA